MKRVIALLLTLVMLLGLVPTALAAEAAAPDGTVVKAEEVSGTPRLDAIRRDQKKVFAEIQAAQPAALQAEGTRTACAPELMEQWTVLFNGMAVRAPHGMLDTIRSLKGVKSAHVQHVYSQPASPATNAGVAGYSYDMVHLQEVWNKGYTGKGMLVAVVDSGLDMEYSSWWSDEEGANVTGLRRVHEAFRDDSFYSHLSDSDLRYTKESLLAFLNGRQLNANRLSPASNEAMYKTRKVPFAFDYAGDADPYTGEIISGDVNVRNSGSNHGTHVSGTVAGFVQSQEGEILFSGVAPDAQLMMMKVFADGGNSGATESAILNALEDAMTLGAGLVNAAAAISTPAYIDVDGKLVGKLELGDDPGWSGSYDLDFRVENLGSDTLSYSMKAVLLRPDTAEQDGKTMVLASDVLIREVDLGSVSVPAGGTQVSRTVSLTASDIAAIRDLFPNGSYVEGFVILTAADGSAPQIGMPLLAFLGDWTSAPILDRANWFDEPQDGENVMNNDCTLGVNVVGSTIRSAGEVVNFLNLGQNIFDTDIAAGSKQTVFHQENFAISPDGSGYFDAIDDLELYQLRDAKLFVIEVRNKNTNELYFRTFNTYVPRSVYQAGYGVVLPMSLYYFTDAWDGTDLNGDVLPNGTQCVYTITAYGEGDYGDTVDNDELGRPVTDFESFVDGKEPTFNGHKMDKTGDVLSFDVLVDTQAPKLENNAVTFYQKDGRTYMQGTVYDEDGSLASVAVHAQVSRTYTDSTGREITEYNIDLLNPLYSQSIYDADTHTFTFTADVTEYRGSYNWTGNVYLSCGDYAANDRTYAIKVDASQGLTLSQTSARLHPGQSFDLSVNNNTGSTAPITRTSSNPEVATVDENGVVTAHKPGYAYIKVSTDINTSVTAYCVVEVLPGQGYTVTLDANGGTVKPDSVSVQYGMAVGQLPVPVREGYTFDGWYDENGAQYTEDTIYAIAGDATLTARWTANIYEITLDANGGVTDVALVQVTFGQAVGALPVPTREGYVFLGWFDEAGSRYDASTVYSTADGVTLTARWGQEDSTFTITLNANGGKVEPSALAVVYGQAVGALPVPTREGYTFGGWYDKDGSRYDASTVYSVKGDTTLTARWIENSVQTGDGFPFFLLSGAMMAAAAGAVMLLLKRRKLMGE